MSVSPLSSTTTTPASSPVETFIQKRLAAPDPHGHPNTFQIIDQMNISPQAKQALEQSVAGQDLAFAHAEQGQTLSSAQKQFVFNGNVYHAVQNLASGQGSVQAVGEALAARGQRMLEVVGNTDLTTSSVSSTSDSSGS